MSHTHTHTHTHTQNTLRQTNKHTHTDTHTQTHTQPQKYVYIDDGHLRVYFKFTPFRLQGSGIVTHGVQVQMNFGLSHIGSLDRG